jgi:hypothetical protein
VSTADYLTGVGATTVVVVAMAAAAAALRRRWLPGWTGSPARLAEAVLGLSLLTVLAQLLGAVGWLDRWPLVASACVIAIAAVALTPSSRASTTGLPEQSAEPPDAPPLPPWASLAAVVTGAVVAVQWVVGANRALRAGITNVDSLQYHLPFAARFAQSGRTFDVHYLWIDPVWSFYPANAELQHAVGMVLFGRDVLSPVLNLAWLGLALLAGWVMGRRYGVSHLTLGAVALLVATPLFASSQPGSAMNDAAALACLLAALAILVVGDRQMPVVVVAGLAAGLAAGTKMTTLAPLIAVTVALVATTPRGQRVRTAAAWAAAMLATGGFWYLRNLVRIGSPLPMLAIPGLPSPHLPAVDAYGFSVAHYLGNGRFWRDYVPSGLRLALGPSYPVLLLAGAVGLAVTAASLATRRARTEDATGAPLRRAGILLLAGGVVGCATYVVTPVTAYGPEGTPFLFFANLRYLFPGLVCCLCLLALATVGRRPSWSGALTVVMGTVLLVELAARTKRQPSALREHPSWFVAATIVCVVAWVVARGRGDVLQRDPRVRVAAAAAAVVVALVGVAGFESRADRFAERRSSTDQIVIWAKGLHDQRIAVAGFANQYVLFGSDRSNEVQYIGDERSGGEFGSFRTCAAFRRALYAGGYGYLVAGTEKWGLEPPRELAWAATDPSAQRVFQVGPARARTVVFRVAPEPRDPTAGCSS